MDETMSGKGYIQGGEGYFITSTGEFYAYHDGELTLVGGWGIPA